MFAYFYFIPILYNLFILFYIKVYSVPPGFIRAQARKAQGPIDFVRILFFFLIIRAFLGGLTWSKTLEN